MLIVDKLSMSSSIRRVLLVALLTLLQVLVDGCNFETDTKVEIATDSIPPVFSFKGSGTSLD